MTVGEDVKSVKDQIMVQSTQPQEPSNKLWIKENAEEEYTVPTYDEFEALSSALNVLEPTATSGDVGKFLKAKTVADGKVTEYEFGMGGGVDPSDIESAVENYLEEHPVVVSSAGIVSVSDYGAVGDGVTDDSAAIQRAVNDNYDVYFESNKTYYLGSTVTIDHDIHIHGGENTIIKTKTPLNGTINNGIVVQGTLKKTTAMTSDYSAVGNSTENAGNRFKLSDMTGIETGDIMVISATDQYYSYNRQYYYLGATLLVAETDSEYLYVSDSMPWDIENTANVSVKVYDAPVAIVENLHFVSDLDSSGTYRYCVEFMQCKNSVIRNCIISEMDNGFEMYECVNTLVDCVNVSKTPGIGQQSHDHYGIAVYACSNTVISRVMGECANSCIDLSGFTPNMNTYIKYCNLFGSNRIDGLGMHENAYNTIVEDCVLGGMVAYGTVFVNRCRFVQRNKVSNSNVAISYRGSHNEKWARLVLTNCIIEGENLQVYIAKPAPQSPIMAYDHVIGEVSIRDCVGGLLVYIPTEDQTILSNTVKRLVLDNWRNCKEIYRNSIGRIEDMYVKNCNFLYNLWINSHNGQFCFDRINYCHLLCDNPRQNRLFVNLQQKGGRFNLPSNVSIAFSSSDLSAHYVICGKNIASNSADDYSAGSVSGSVGGTLNRNVNSGFANSISTDGNGNITFTNASTDAVSVYLKCFAYAGEASQCSISCNLKNTGATSGSTFRMTIAEIDADTRKIRGITQAQAIQATAGGAEATCSRIVSANTLIQFYIYCNNGVLNAETTFEELMFSLAPADIDTIEYVAYQGVRLDGNGNLKSLNGINRIMASVYDFNASFKNDFEDIAVSSGGGGGGGACTSITLSNGLFSLNDYNPVTVGYTVVPSDTSDIVVWTSSDTSVFTVADGVITAKGLGTATLTATCGQQTATATVSVELPYISNFDFGFLTKTNTHANVGENYSWIMAIGDGQQKAHYGFVPPSGGIVRYPILLPNNTKEVHISYDTSKSSMIYNNTANLIIYWFADEPSSDVGYGAYAKCLTSEQTYNLRNDGLISLEVPEGANAVFANIRASTTYTSENDPNTIAETMGLTIEFLDTLTD